MQFTRSLTSLFLLNVLTSASWAYGTTNTGLDEIIQIINTDAGLQKKVDATGIQIASESADRMNHIILEAIIATGGANDGKISTADTRSINDYIHEYHYDEWLVLHGDDENGIESGFHYVQANGNKSTLFGNNAINQVADGIYHLGFETNKKMRLQNEDGKANKTFMSVAHWLDTLLTNELSSGSLVNAQIEEVYGTTGTGLDEIIDVIYADVSLANNISIDDMREAAYASDGMNNLIIAAIEDLSLNSDNEISVDDAKAINTYLVDYYLDDWIEFHGDDEDGEETGYHLAQSDGAKTYKFGENMINKVFDGIYHIGFPADEKGRRLLNEDGDKNVSFMKAAYWLNALINQ